MSRPLEHVPELSVAIALKEGRTEDPLEGVLAWARGQDCERSRLEVVVAANGDHPDWERRIPDILTPADRFIRPEPRLGTGGLMDAAARAARGKWIYFCELHTVPDPGCAREMLDYLESHDLAGASAESGSRGDDAVSRMEARYFQEVVGSRLGRDEGLVPIRGVALRRDVLAKVGWLDPGVTIFAERVLAARLREAGARIGHAARARFVHKEQGSLRGHREDVALYTWGEHAFRSSHDAAFCDRHFGRPEEWTERQGYRRGVARARAGALAGAVWRAARGAPDRRALRSLPGLAREGLREVGRLAFGAWGEIVYAWLATGLAELRFVTARDDERRFRAHLDIKRHYTRCVRLYCIGRDLRAEPLPPPIRRSQHEVGALGEDELVGFHAREEHDGRTFRWSAPSALVRLSIPADDYRVRIDTGGLRRDLGELLLALHWNGRAVAGSDVHVEDGEVRFPVAREAFAPGGEQRLALACAALRLTPGGEERRRLGLPVFSFAFDRVR